MSEDNAVVPVEKTLTMQSYVQIRDDVDIEFLDVFIPSTNLESQLGWDMEIRNLKGIVFQFKRPKEYSDGTRKYRTRRSNTDSQRQLGTMRNYAEKYGTNIAYYALPLVREHGELENTLPRTVFVKANDIPKHTSLVKIPQGYCKDGKTQSDHDLETHCSNPENPREDYWEESIDSSGVFGWQELYAEIMECNVGFRIRNDGSNCKEKYNNIIQQDLTVGKDSSICITQLGSNKDVFSQ